MNIWWALLFMTLGGVIVWLFDRYAWMKYYEGKNETVKHNQQRRC